LPENLVILSVLTADVPEVEENKRVETHALGHGVYRVTGHNGFMETPDVPEILAKARRQGLDIDLENVTYYLGRINLVPARKKNMTRWQRFLFAFLLRNAVSRSTYLNIPPAKVLEIGVQMEF
jgi:KUP system potassium uptake protein